jgi:hypothetical protein
MGGLAQVHSFFSWYLGYFCFRVIVNNAAMNIGGQGFICVFIFLVKVFHRCNN